jgi:hypothetical protein
LPTIRESWPLISAARDLNTGGDPHPDALFLIAAGILTACRVAGALL